MKRKWTALFGLILIMSVGACQSPPANSPQKKKECSCGHGIACACAPGCACACNG